MFRVKKKCWSRLRDVDFSTGVYRAGHPCLLFALFLLLSHILRPTARLHEQVEVGSVAPEVLDGDVLVVISQVTSSEAAGHSAKVGNGERAPTVDVAVTDVASLVVEDRADTGAHVDTATAGEVAQGEVGTTAVDRASVRVLRLRVVHRGVVAVSSEGLVVSTSLEDIQSAQTLLEVAGGELLLGSLDVVASAHGAGLVVKTTSARDIGGAGLVLSVGGSDQGGGEDDVAELHLEK